MKEIVDRLQENRQIELAKSILESKGYHVEKLKESEVNQVPADLVWGSLPGYYKNNSRYKGWQFAKDETNSNSYYKYSNGQNIAIVGKAEGRYDYTFFLNLYKDSELIASMTPGGQMKSMELGKEYVQTGNYEIIDKKLPKINLDSVTKNLSMSPISTKTQHEGNQLVLIMPDNYTKEDFNKDMDRLELEYHEGSSDMHEFYFNDKYFYQYVPHVITRYKRSKYEYYLGE